MSDIQEEQKRICKRAEENDKEQVCLKVSMTLFEEKELEIFDNNIHTIIEEYSKLHLEKKEQILTQRIIIKQEQEINRLNNIINELTEEYINYMDKQDFAKKCNISRPYLDKLLKKMNRKEIYEFCKIRNKLKGDNK